MKIAFSHSIVVLIGLICAAQAATQKATLPSKKPPAEKESYSTADFLRVVDKSKELATRYGNDEVLVVFDIDNTLLAMNQDLGSDQWFNWQSQLMKDEPDSPDLVADDFAGLLEVQGTLFALSKMHPPEPKLPDHIAAIQKLDVTTVVLTSRGFAYRDAAERELNRNGYDLASSALRIQEQRGLFMPFDPEQPDAHGLSPEIIEGIQGRLGPVTYSNGIYMTAGQHKGYMLRTLLARAKTKKQFKAILFVDDHEKHTIRMHAAYEDSPVHLVTFHYTREAGNASNFHASQKNHVIEDWRRLEDFVDSVLVK
ncbi:MAG: DUF2608 domain-containing protein [Planctomycetota bacterium]